MFNNLKSDIRRYTQGKGGKDTFYVFFEQGLWAIAVYRFGRWVRRVKLPVIAFLLRFCAFLLFKLTEIVTGVSLPASASIGKGFYVGHFGPCICHSDVKIGEHCAIGPGVVIGTRGLGDRGVPVLGNNVYVGVGAKILGGLTIGDGARIGANAVVIDDVPAGTTVVGIPAKPVRSSG